MEGIGRAVARVVGGGAAEPPVVPEGRVAEPRRRGGEVVLPAMSPALPRLPRALSAWVARAAEPAPDPRPEGEPPREVDGGIVAVPARVPPTPATAAEKAEAREPAARLRRILSALAHPEAVEAWLLRATAAVANAPAGDARRMWVAALVPVLCRRPDACFSVETAMEALERWKWWPSGAEVVAFVDEVAERYRAVLRGLEAVERAPVATGPGRERPPEADRPAARTPEEIAAVQAARDAFLAEVAARAASERAGRPLGVAARVLSPGQLIALFEAQAARAGDPEARDRLLFRARVLRERHPGVAS